MALFLRLYASATIFTPLLLSLRLLGRVRLAMCPYLTTYFLSTRLVVVCFFWVTLAMQAVQTPMLSAADVQHLQNKYPDKVPVIVSRAADSKLPDIDQR